MWRQHDSRRSRHRWTQYGGEEFCIKCMTWRAYDKKTGQNKFWLGTILMHMLTPYNTTFCQHSGSSSRFRMITRVLDSTPDCLKRPIPISNHMKFPRHQENEDFRFCNSCLVCLRCKCFIKKDSHNFQSKINMKLSSQELP